MQPKHVGTGRGARARICLGCVRVAVCQVTNSKGCAAAASAAVSLSLTRSRTAAAAEKDRDRARGIAARASAPRLLRVTVAEAVPWLLPPDPPRLHSSCPSQAPVWDRRPARASPKCLAASRKTVQFETCFKTPFAGLRLGYFPRTSRAGYQTRLVLKAMQGFPGLSLRFRRNSTLLFQRFVFVQPTPLSLP